MSRAFVLWIIILISSLPIIAVYIWFHFAKYQFSLHRFLFALLAGAAAFFPALILQALLSFSFHSGRTAIFFQHFIRIALSEEISRLLLLLIFFMISNRITRNSGHLSDSPQPSFDTIKKATATGLVAGLGFALLESAVYAASDIRVLPLRIIITAAVHGACGSRIGAAAVLIRTNPFQAIIRILTATAIHGIYNMLIIMPGFSPVAAILIAVSALFSAIVTIRGGWLGDIAENTPNPILNNPPPNEPPLGIVDKNENNSVN